MRTPVLSFLVLSAVLVSSPALASGGNADRDGHDDHGHHTPSPSPWHCGRPDRHATPTQVLQARFAAMARQDLNAIACSYAEDAVVILPGSVVRGRDAVMQAFAGFAALLGGAAPTIASLTAADEVVLVLYSVTTPSVSIPDGADTFIVRDGQIATQTVHGSFVFSTP